MDTSFAFVTDIYIVVPEEVDARPVTQTMITIGTILPYIRFMVVRGSLTWSFLYLYY